MVPGTEEMDGGWGVGVSGLGSLFGSGTEEGKGGDHMEGDGGRVQRSLSWRLWEGVLRTIWSGGPPYKEEQENTRNR